VFFPCLTALCFSREREAHFLLWASQTNTHSTWDSFPVVSRFCMTLFPVFTRVFFEKYGSIGVHREHLTLNVIIFGALRDSKGAVVLTLSPLLLWKCFTVSPCEELRCSAMMNVPRRWILTGVKLRWMRESSLYWLYDCCWWWGLSFTYILNVKYMHNSAGTLSRGWAKNSYK
jgi:hypothetical protein